jgi:hypothetical protein
MPDALDRDRTLTQMLTGLHEHFSATACGPGESEEYRRGHAAGMGFVRLCVLDQLAGASITSGAEQNSARRHRRELAALRAIRDRLDEECGSAAPAGVDAHSAGYRAGISTARAYIDLALDAIELRREGIAVG